MKKRALLIGNGEFKHKDLRTLRAPKKDIEELATVLRHSLLGGFEVSDHLNKSSDELKAEIEQFFIESEPDDILLFYFSGHGILSTDRKDFFLATFRTQITLILEGRSSAFDNNIYWREIEGLMKKSPARHQIIILDCCNPPVEGAKYIPTQSIPFSNNNIDAEEKFCFQFTATDDKYPLSWEDKDGELSLFTKHLIQGLKTGQPDEEGDGVIYLEELYNYVRDSVKHESRKNQRRQSPKLIELSLKKANIKFPIATYPAYELSIRVAKLLGNEIKWHYEPIYNSKKDPDSKHLHWNNQPFVVDLPLLYIPTQESDSPTSIKVQLWKRVISETEPSFLSETTIRVKENITSVKLQCIQISSDSPFEIKPLGNTCQVLRTPIYNDYYNPSPPVISPSRPANLLYILDGTMDKANLEMAKQIIQEFSYACRKIPVKFGCFVYREYNYFIGDKNKRYKDFKRGEELPEDFSITPNMAKGLDFDCFVDYRKLKYFLSTVQHYPIFEEQDTADVLELAFHYVSGLNEENLTWIDNDKYIILLGNSYPHPNKGDIKNTEGVQDIFDFLTDEFYGLSWVELLQNIKNFIPDKNRLALWMGMGGLTLHRFSKLVWEKFDGQGRCNIIRKNTDVQNSRLLNDFYDQLNIQQKSTLRGNIPFPMLENYEKIFGSDYYD